MLTTRTIVIALVLVASTLSACGNRQSDSAIQQLEINQPTPSRPAAPPEHPNSRQTQSMSNLTNEAWVTSRTGRDVTFINAVYPIGYEFNQEWDPMQGIATDTVVQIVYKQYLDDSGNCNY